ncbi:MAG: TRAP transporter large permease subunit, partial [Gammaproteobacteria bacterium]
MMELMPLLMFLAAFIVLLAGYPVALTLAGVALSFAFVGIVSGSFDVSDLGFLTGRLFGIVTNQTLIAVPLFVLMGVMLEKSRIAETLLDSMSILCGRLRGGLGISVTLVGMLMAASTGIVGATVVTMGLMSLPTMLRHGYDKRLATGTICATGTLGQIIPPSIALVLLGDVMSNAYQEAQLSQGIFAPRTVSVGDLFAGAVFPGLLLVLFYVIYILVVALVSRERAPLVPMEELSRGRAISIVSVLLGLAPPLLLIIAVLGSILAGIATPTEAAGVGALGALL